MKAPRRIDIDQIVLDTVYTQADPEAVSTLESFSANPEASFFLIEGGGVRDFTILLGLECREEGEVKRYALKMPIDSDAARQMFQEEAWAAEKCSDIEGVLTLMALFPGVMVYEYVDGFSLDRLDGSRLKDMSDSEKLAVIHQIALTMEQVHNRNCIHKDLKTGNVMIDELGRVKLLDFGIAHNLDREPEGSEEWIRKTRTMTGSVGTVSPEIISRQGYGKATDIFALGILGLSLFDDKILMNGSIIKYMGMVKSLVMGEEHILGNFNIPPEILAIFVRAVRHDSRQRYRSMNELAVVIQGVMKEMADLSGVGIGNVCGRIRHSVFNSLCPFNDVMEVVVS